VVYVRKNNDTKSTAVNCWGRESVGPVSQEVTSDLYLKNR
jgi:hypothetical protein